MLLGSLNDKKDFYEQNLEAPQGTLQESLLKQIAVLIPLEQQELARQLLEKLDSSGYLKEPHEEIAQELSVTPAILKSIIHKLQTCEPSGVFAQNLEESLYIQLKDKKPLLPLL